MRPKMLLLLLAWGALLTACNRAVTAPTTQPAAEVPTRAAPASAASAPTTSPLASPTRTPAPTATARPVTPTARPAPAEEGLLPVLYGRLDDPEALTRALEVGDFYAPGEMWIASLPPHWPEVLPLPTVGEPLLTERLTYGPDEAWSVLWHAPDADIEAWWQAYHDALAAAGWTAGPDFPPPGGGFAPPGMTGYWDWLCSPDGTWTLNLEALAADGTTWARLGFHQNPAEGGGPCGDEAHASQPDGLLPSLTLPAGARLLSQSGGGSAMLGSENQVTFETSLDLAEVVASFTAQLQDQGWEPATAHEGTLWGMPAAYVQARRTTERSTYGLHLLVWGTSPRLTAWMGVYDADRLAAQPEPRPQDAGGTVTLHRGQADVATLRQALRLWHWQTFTTAPPQVWVGVAPTPWPLDALPQPADATWIKAVTASYPGNGETVEPSQHWSLFFEMPQEPDAARAALQALLEDHGWTRLEGLPDPGPRLNLDVSPLPPREEIWCAADSAWSVMQSVQPVDGGSRVTWTVDNEGPCLWQEGKGIPAGPDIAAAMPALRLTPPDERPARGGGATWDYGADGRVRAAASALWWTEAEPNALGLDLAAQLDAQGWEVTAQGVWSAGLVWVEARHPATEEGGPWQARVLALPMPDGWVWMRVVVEEQP